MRLRKGSVALIAVAYCALFASGCDSPFFPKAATSFVPPASYRLDWRIVEYCSGLQRAFDDVGWYRTEGSASSGERAAAGAYYPNGNRIVLNDAFTEDHEVIRHEMLHALQPSVERHTANFLRECRGLVSCPVDCSAEAGGLGPQPGLGSSVVPPESLEVITTVLPWLPGDGTLIAVIVAARNPQLNAVWVDLSTVSRRQFICRIGTAPCGRLFLYPSDSAAFGPGEKRAEATVTSLLSGSYTVNGFFNSKAAAPVGVTIP